MHATAFVYIVYIRTTPEKLWQGLTDPTFTRRYWGAEFDTDWKPGSAMVWTKRGVRTVHPDQVVLEADPCRRLSYTWHTFTAEWARTAVVNDRILSQLSAERRSRVTFDLKPTGETVKLTLVHDGFEPDGTLRPMIQEGWPVLLSSLKTLLESGRPLPMPEPNRATA